VSKNLKFYYNSKVEKPWSDVQKIQNQLQQLKRAGIEIEIVDTTTMTEQELYDIYTEASTPSIRKHLKIRQVFGSQNKSGVFFGRQQPALLVYSDDSKYPSDVYPHDEDGKRISIEEYLERRIRQAKKKS
jgi:hypothetical protein